MPEDLKQSQIGSSQLPPPFRGLHSPGVRKHCQIIFACHFRKSSISERVVTLTIANPLMRRYRTRAHLSNIQNTRTCLST